MITGFDIAVAVVVLLSMLIGVLRGFIRETLSLISWVLAFWIAFTFSPKASGYFAPYLATPALQVVAAFAALFLVALLIASFVSYLLYKLFKATGITGTDRALGAVFGVARGVALVALCMLFIGATALIKEPWWQQSLSVVYFKPLITILVDLLPVDVGQRLGYK
jgi:membrane protein required for colicin V production